MRRRGFLTSGRVRVKSKNLLQLGLNGLRELKRVERLSLAPEFRNTLRVGDGRG